MPAVGAPSGSSTDQAFWALVLADMGAPDTPSNVQGLQAWSEREGGGGAWNPLNTTRPEPGSTFFNHLSSGTGVQNYTSMQQGAQATADSINNGRYPSIVAAFKTGSAFEALVSGGKGPIGAQLRTWSGGAYNNVNFGSSGYVSPTLGGAKGQSSGSVGSTSSSGGTSTATGGCLTLGESVSNASQTPIVGGLPGEAQMVGLFAWITQGCVQKRLLIQGVSALMILYGLKFMGHSEPIKIVTAPMGAAAKGGAMLAAE